MKDDTEDAAAEPAGSSAPRTVLYVDDAMSYGGSLVVTALLAKYLDPKRYRAVVVAQVDQSVLHFLFGKTASYHRVPHTYNYLERVQMRDRWGGASAGLVTRALRYALHLVRHVADWRYQLRLAGVILRERVDLIHDSNGYVSPFLALLGRPMVGTLQGFTKPYGWLQRMALRRFGAFIMISSAVRDHYIACGGRPEIVRLLPNPCDPQPITDELRERMRKKFGLRAGAKVFGIIGRVVEWKGQREFLAAALLVLAEIPDAVAMIVGDAADGTEAYFEELRSTAAASPFRDRVLFTGYVEETVGVYAVLDVAGHASITPEPFGLVVIEAPGHGVPIVAANDGGPLDIVEDGVDGFLVDPRDTRALASAISRLLRDDALRARVGAKGREKVMTKYHAKPYTEQVQTLYDGILNARD